MQGPVRLAQSTLGDLPAAVARPSYARDRVREGIVHIGVGGFHRAHQAVYIDELMERHGLDDWAICGLGMLAQDRALHDALSAQDGLFTVIEREGDVARPRVIGSHRRSLLATQGVAQALEALASESTRIVSLTITEGGYLCDEASGAFAADHPDVRSDLAHPETPRTAVGLMVRALAVRRARGLRPFTVLSCDNLEHNGERARAMCLGYAELLDAHLADHLREHGAFPCSMVDRITPATQDADRALLAQRFGLVDRWPVVCEPFRQWVLEDRFALGRPPLELAGVELVADVQPYERMKLRLLNAGHSALGYLGHLAGLTFVHEAAADPQLARLLERFMEHEVSPLLPPVPGIDLVQYRRTLVQRFANAAIADRLGRLCAQGSAKMPKFVLPTLREQLARGVTPRFTTLIVAAYLRYLSGLDERGQPYVIDDALAPELTRLAREGGPDPRALLSSQALFGSDLANHASFVAELATALRSLHELGVRKTLTVALAAPG